MRIGYGFIFPDSYFDDKIINAVMVDASVKPFRGIFVDKSQLPEMAKHTIDIMQYWKHALGNNELGDERVQLIIKSVCPEFDGTPDWGIRIIYDNKLWLRLTHEQIKVIELLSEYQRVVVTGWPGTGKTLIGIEFARRLVKGQKRFYLLLSITFFQNIFGNKLRSHYATFLPGTNFVIRLETNYPCPPSLRQAGLNQDAAKICLMH